MHHDTLADWLDWQATLHPEKIDLGLERVAAVWARLGPQPLPFPVITVGGTNGKGSCVAMLEAIYLAAGYRVATYSSPHLLVYNERVRLNGEAVGDQPLCEAFARVEAARGRVSLTYFEYGTLAALDLFVRAAVDLAILEVGLGGRLDAVNLWDADVAVVTSIGLDHTAWLGETLEAIAREKAGIFRPGRPAVIGQADAPPALRAAAGARQARVIQRGREMDVEMATSGWIWRGPDGERLALPLPTLRGGFQLDNAAAAITAARQLGERLPVSLGAIRVGLARARLPGRFQVLPGTPTWILDVAHNGAAAQALATNLQGFATSGRVLAVLAVLADKSPEAIVAPLRARVDHWYLAQTEDARAMPARTLRERLGELPNVTTLDSVAAALTAAHAAAGPGDAILVLGSFVTVGAALGWLGPTPARICSN